MKRAFSFFAILIFLFETISANNIHPTLIGKWKIESIKAESNQSVQMSGAFSSGTEIVFGADGTLAKVLKNSDKRTYQYDDRLGEIVVQEGHAYERYAVKYISNGHLQLTSEDGVVLELSR